MPIYNPNRDAVESWVYESRIQRNKQGEEYKSKMHQYCWKHTKTWDQLMAYFKITLRNLDDALKECKDIRCSWEEGTLGSSYFYPWLRTNKKTMFIVNASKMLQGLLLLSSPRGDIGKKYASSCYYILLFSHFLTLLPLHQKKTKLKERKETDQKFPT